MSINAVMRSTQKLRLSTCDVYAQDLAARSLLQHEHCPCTVVCTTLYIVVSEILCSGMCRRWQDSAARSRCYSMNTARVVCPML